MNDNKNKLFPEFPPVTTREWEERIKADLKCADYEKKLISKTIEGITIKPYYRSENLNGIEYLNTYPGEFPYVRGFKKDNNRWEIRQDINETDFTKANPKAKEAISRGAEAIGFNAKEVENKNDMKVLLDGIDLHKISIHFIDAHSYLVIFRLFTDEAKRKNTDLKKIRGSFNFDSLSYFLLYGKFYASEDDNFMEASSLLSKAAKTIPQFKCITINGQYFHNAGANVAQELGFSLASANEYLIKFKEKGLAVDDVASRIKFVFATGSDYFLEISKFRAARLLWAKIAEQYNPAFPESCLMNIHAVTSLWNKSVYDPYVNMLRNTTETMSAAIGGCDSITVNPFDITYRKPDAVSERIARNTQLVLKEESYLDKIADVSAGSYYIESLTDAVAETAWKIFLKVEEAGGFIHAVKTGFIKEDIEKTCRKRDTDIAMRKQVILGTNQYPNLKEKMLDKIKPHADTDVLGRLRMYRGAQAFEALRLATESYVKNGHKLPTVFLFAYGNLTMRKARANFTTNFFGCSGYKIIDDPGFKNLDEGMEAAKKSKAEIIVFCSSDNEYAALTPDFCAKLKAGTPNSYLIVAGNPATLIEQLQQSGINDFISIRSDVLAVLEKYQHLFGII
ncbi:MAG: acyl-CoA mutase large subunit family protein [Bacteroidota bacterium]